MKKKSKYTLYIILVGLILIAGYFMYSRRKKNFSDNGQAGALNKKFGNGSDIGGNVGFKSENAHNLKVGDKVEIIQNEGFTYPEYNGETVVTHIITDTIFAVNKPFLGNTPINSGQYRKLSLI